MYGFGVNPTPRGVQGSLPGMGFSYSGSFHHSSDSASPSVCVTSSRSGSMETKCVLLPLGRSQYLRLCSHPSHSGESSGFAVCMDDVGGSPVAAGGLVSPTAGFLGGQSMSTAFVAVPSSPAPSSSLPQVPGDAPTSHVETPVSLQRARVFAQGS